MSTLTFVLLTLVSQAGSSFEALRASADAMDRPANAIEALFGDCEQQDPVLQIKCQENVATERKRYRGKTFYVDLGAGHQQLLEFEGERRGKARFLWVPMYDAGNGFALTVGRPKRLNKQGWPLLPKKILDGKLPDGMLASDVRRLALLGQVNIELIGRMGKPWRLGRGKGRVRGVTWKLKAIRLSAARTGASLVDLVYK